MLLPSERLTATRASYWRRQQHQQVRQPSDGRSFRGAAVSAERLQAVNGGLKQRTVYNAREPRKQRVSADIGRTLLHTENH